MPIQFLAAPNYNEDQDGHPTDQLLTNPSFGGPRTVERRCSRDAGVRARYQRDAAVELAARECKTPFRPRIRAKGPVKLELPPDLGERIFNNAVKFITNNADSDVRTCEEWELSQLYESRETSRRDCDAPRSLIPAEERKTRGKHRTLFQAKMFNSLDFGGENGCSNLDPAVPR